MHGTNGHFNAVVILCRSQVCHLPENGVSNTKMWCAADNHNDACHTCAKGFLDLDSI